MNQVQNIQFHGQIVPVFTQNDTHYAAMKPICENIGLDWVSQHKKIQRNQILNSTMVMMTMVAEDGKQREMVCLPLEYLNGWLFGVDASRVKPEIRETLLRYQRECFKVLNEHFNRPLAPWETPIVSEGSLKQHAGVEAAVQALVEQAAMPSAPVPEPKQERPECCRYGFAGLMAAYGAEETFLEAQAAFALSDLSDIQNLINDLITNQMQMGIKPDWKRWDAASRTLFQLQQAAREAARATRPSR